MLTNLQTFNKDGLELIINTETGESFASVSGYARISGKGQSTISERIVKHKVIEAQIHTKTGFKTVRLISEDLIVAWLPKDNPEMATKMMKAGVRMFLHTLAGYEVKSTAIEPKSQAELILMYAQELVKQEKRVDGIEREVNLLREENQLLKEKLKTHDLEIQANSCELDRFKNGQGYWYTVLGYAKLQGIQLSLQESKTLGSRATALSRIANIVPNKVTDPRFGLVNTYPEHILSEVF